MGLNCFVHVPMYWYFAYPKGALLPYRKNITQLQIIQHIICVLTSIHIYNLDNCEQNYYGKELGLGLYVMYLLYFVHFYVMAYINKLNTIKKNS